MYVQIAIIRVNTKLSLGITLENRKFEFLVAARVRVRGRNLQEKYLWDNVLTDFFRVRYRVKYGGIIVVVLNRDNDFGCVTEERSAGVTNLNENQSKTNL